MARTCSLSDNGFNEFNPNFKGKYAPKRLSRHTLPHQVTKINDSMCEHSDKRNYRYPGQPSKFNPVKSCEIQNYKDARKMLPSLDFDCGMTGCSESRDRSRSRGRPSMQHPTKVYGEVTK